MHLFDWGVTTQTPLLLPVDSIVYRVDNQPTPLNEYEQYIVDWGQQHLGEVLKARTLKQTSRLFEDIAAEDIRIIFSSLAVSKLGEVVGTGDRLGWVWTKPED